MRTGINKTRVRAVMAPLVSLGLLAILAWPVVAQAQEMELRPYNNGRGMKSPVRTPQERSDGPKAVRIAGTFRHNNRDGLTLQDQTVSITANTAVFPAVNGRSYLPDPTDLRGRRGTVFGRPGPNGIEAVLVILEMEAGFRLDVPELGDASEIGDAPRGAVEMPPGTPQ